MSATHRLERRHWIGLGLTLLVAFLVLGFFGVEVYRQAPPIPERVVSADGAQIFTRDDILTGQQVWQSTGGQQLGSVWGHGAYQAPDWSADWLHREALALLEVWAQAQHGKPFSDLERGAQAALRDRLVAEMRHNAFDPTVGTLTISAARARAVAAVSSHYDGLFGGAPEQSSLRESYAMQEQVVPDG